MNNLSLFSGIGGMDLGLERAGMKTVGQVEINPYSRSVLARHWPEVPRHDDVCTALDWWRSQERPEVDVISGGFPCQPFSNAGLKAGTEDERDLWPVMRDIIEGIRPQYVIGENVPGLLRWNDGAAFRRCLEDLSKLGYVVEWSIVSACAVGAPFMRKRLFIVAIANGEHGQERVAGADEQAGNGAGSIRPSGVRQHAWNDPGVWLAPARSADRVANGLAGRMVAAGGNAVVPDVAELIGRRVMAYGRG